MEKEPGYRLNVGLIIINDKGKLLICKRKDINSWQFPQGGIDFGETPLKAAKRELFEEVGIKGSSVRNIGSMDDWIKYDIPKENRKKRLLQKNFKGQKQKWFMFKLIKNIDVSFENDPDGEFDDYKWVSYWYPLQSIISFKKDVYRTVLCSLRVVFCMEQAGD